MFFHFEKDLSIPVHISTKQRVGWNVYETTHMNYLISPTNNRIYIDFAFTIVLISAHWYKKIVPTPDRCCQKYSDSLFTDSHTGE